MTDRELLELLRAERDPPPALYERLPTPSALRGCPESD